MSYTVDVAIDRSSSPTLPSLPQICAICAWNSARQKLYTNVFLVSTEFGHSYPKVTPELTWMVNL